ncbi:MAG: ATP-binding cassette domain-containing protein [Phycisphaerales bacterium]
MAASSQVSTSGATPVVACQRLSKIFRDFWMRPRVRAVEDLSFEIAPREVFGLLGPNGSGKSTTIKMILGLLHPTRGRLLVFGKPPTDVGIKARIGYLPEESFLYPFLNARETLEYYAKLFEITGKVRKKRIDELLDMVGLSAAQHRPVREYSKGMQRRIGLAQALINDPDFLILDEPTTGLDPIGTRQVKDLILELGRRGKTILLSSHLLADVEDVVDRMAILYGGKKRDEGTTDQLLTKHSKTTIETDALDEDTIAAIDELIRARSGGVSSILAVMHPRQKLEEKFLDIVEQARRDRMETSGAASGGRTASFLAAAGGHDAEPESTESVIERLTNREPSPADEAPAPSEAASSEPEQEDRDVVSDLMEPESMRDEAPAPPVRRSPTESSQRERSAPTAPPADQGSGGVDRGMIDSLLGGTGDPADGGEERRS